MAIVPIGMSTYEVSAEPGSYVALSKDGVLHGAGMVDETGTLELEIEPITSGGDCILCVTSPRFIPSIEEIPAAALEGAYISVNEFTPENAHVGEESNLSITFKNVGADPTTGTTTVTLSCDDPNLTITNGTATFGVLAPEATVELSGFTYQIAEGVADGTRFRINTIATCGSNTWEGKVNITAGEAVLNFAGYDYAGGFVPGENVTVAVNFKNTGHYMASNAVATIASTSQYVTINEGTQELGTIDPAGTATAVFHVNVAANCPETEQLPLTFNLVADGGLTAEGTGSLKNACAVIFELSDSYGDGWNGSSLRVAYSDGTPTENLTIDSGSSATFTREIGNGVHVTVTFNEGSWSYECSYVIKYEDGTIIHQGQQDDCEFDVNCAGSSATGDLDPVENLNASVNGVNVTLTWDAPQGATSYIITRNGLTIGETSETTFTDEIPGELTYTYSVSAVYADGVSVPENILVSVDLNVNENEAQFSIYPNPVNNMLYINGGNAEYSYVMFNGMGQQVANGTAQGAQQINVSGMAKGIYFIRLTAGSKTSVEKVVVE